MKRFAALCFLLCLLLAGCEKEPAEEVLTEEEVFEIVSETLDRAEAANLLYLGAFDGDSDRISGQYVAVKDGYYFNPPFPYTTDLSAMCASFDTAEDIRTLFGDTFVPELAEAYAEPLLSGEEPLYTVVDGWLYRLNIPTSARPPLSLVLWEREGMSLLEQTEDRLVVEVPGRYMLTGHEALLPLTLTKIEGKWLLDETYAASSRNIVPWSWEEDAARAAIEAARQERLAPENLEKILPEAQPIPVGADGDVGRRSTGGAVVAVGETIYLLDESTPPYEIALWRVRDGESTCLFGPVATTEGLANLSVSGDDVYFTLDGEQYAAGLYRLAEGAGTPELVLPFSARVGTCRVYGRTAYVAAEEGLCAVPLDSGGADQAVWIMRNTPEISLNDFIIWEGGVVFVTRAPVARYEYIYCLVSHQTDGQRTLLDSAEEPYMGLKIEDGILYHYD